MKLLRSTCYNRNKISLLTTFLSFLLISIFPANIFAQNKNVTISQKNISILSVFEEIEKQTDYTIAYNESKLNVNQKISVDLKNATLQEALSQTLKGLGLSFTIQGKQIVITPEKATNDGIKVTGTVSDKVGDKIVGAVVRIKGESGVKTVTNIDGQFSLIVPNENTVLEISYLGYNTREILVGNTPNLILSMDENTTTLDEIVVVGYGSQKKVNLTGAVSTVKMDDVLGSRPVGSSAKALEGAIPGLQISRASGKPGAVDFINLRGVTSINDPTSGPLVLIDHVPMDLSMVDPNDIESVSVLKDAAASAIYGARAAFGIILVTTKKAKKDTPIRVNYSNNFAFSNPATLPNKIDPYSTVKVYQDLGIESYYGGQTISKWMNYMDEYYNQGKYPEGYVVGDDMIQYNLAETDAYKDMMASSGFQQQHNLSLTGGSSKSTYRISFGMIDENGILYSDRDGFQRYNASSFVNLDATSWLSGQVDIRYADAKTLTPRGNAEGSDLWYYTRFCQPMAPLGDGIDKASGETYPYTSARHMIMLEDPKTNRNNNIRLIGRAIIKPFKGMEVTGEFSHMRDWWSESTSRKDYYTLNPVSNVRLSSLNGGNTSYSMSQYFTTNNAINVYGTYNILLNQTHNITGMVGFNQEAYYYEALSGSRLDLLVQDLPSLSMAGGTQSTSDNFSEYATRGVFYRFNYDYKGRYLFEANGRYDGSSRFPKEKRFGFFPSFSAGWRLSEETFISDLHENISNIKLRGSWGEIGNQNVGQTNIITTDYGYLPTMSPGNASWILPGGTDWVKTMGQPGIVSSNYTWETVESMDFGIDLGFFKNKLSTTFDWYQRDTKNMLAPAKAGPAVLGANYPKENTAALRTQGWELTIQWKSNIGNDIRYNIGLNLYDSKSEITKYDNPSGILINNGSLVLREGMKYGEIWGYTTDRFYTPDDFEADGKTLKAGIPFVRGYTKPNPGDVVYKNFDGEDSQNPGKYIIDTGNNTFENPGDLKVIGNNTARYQFGVNGGVSWKQFDLSFFFNGVGKRDLIMPNYTAPSGTFVAGVFDYQTDYWKEDNPNAFWPRIYGQVPSGIINNSGANTAIQTKYLQNGAYIRLKNVTLAYNLPRNLCDKIFVQSLRFFASGENLYTWHHLPHGHYPDSYVALPGTLNMAQGIQGDSGSGSWSYPLMRQLSFGLNLTF